LTLREIRRRANPSSINADSDNYGSYIGGEGSEEVLMDSFKGQPKPKDYDCFMFLMMLKSTSDELKDEEHSPVQGLPGAETKSIMGSSKFKHFFNSVKNNLRTHSKLPKVFNLVSKLILKERSLILKKLKEIMRVKVRVQDLNYSYGIGIVEICVMYKKTAGRTVQSFFKLFAENQDASLVEILMISPDNFNNLCN